MTPQEFANKIRTKYPEGVASDGRSYADISDEELSQKVIAKYPVYADQVKFEQPEQPSKLESFGRGIAKGGLETAKFSQDVGQRVLAGVTPKSLEEVRETTGLDFFKRPDIEEKLKAINTPEKIGKFTEFIAELGIGGVTTGGKAVVKAGQVGAMKGKQLVGEGVEAVAERVGQLPEKVKEVVTGIKPKVGEEKIIEDSIEIAREPIDKAYEIKSAQEGRTFTEGRTKQVKFKPTRREELVADALRPLVEQGRISPKNLPFENIPEIQTEVNRINQGIIQMITDRKIPFNPKQLKDKLNRVKKESDIVFTTDPTLERTYDALISEFLRNVEKKDTLGLFIARQEFDKIPAVKKLLEGVKGAQGENLRRQAVLDIRRAVNEFVADLLDTTQIAKARKILQPEEIKPLVQEAKKYPKVADFIRAEKAKLSKRRNFTKPSDWETSVEEDLTEVWNIANSQIVGSSGDVMSNLLRQESYMIEGMGNLAEKSKGLGGSTGVSRYLEENPTLKAIIRQAIPFGAGATIF